MGNLSFSTGQAGSPAPRMKIGGQTELLIPGVAIRHLHSRIEQKTFLPQLRAEPDPNEGPQQVPELPSGVSVTPGQGQGPGHHSHGELCCQLDTKYLFQVDLDSSILLSRSHQEDTATKQRDSSPCALGASQGTAGSQE